MMSITIISTFLLSALCFVLQSSDAFVVVLPSLSAPGEDLPVSMISQQRHHRLHTSSLSTKNHRLYFPDERDNTLADAAAVSTTRCTSSSTTKTTANQLHPSLAALDLNKDGKVDRKDWKIFQDYIMDVLDVNGDRTVNYKDGRTLLSLVLMAWMLSASPAFAKGGGGGRGGGGGGGGSSYSRSYNRSYI